MKESTDIVPVAPEPRAAGTAPNLSLGLLSLEGLVSGDFSQIRAQVQELAENLSSPSRCNQARLTVLAEEIAVTKTLGAIISAITSQRLHDRQFSGLADISRYSASLTQRLTSLLSEHRREVGTRTPILIVGHADNVTVEGGGR
jgi:hypothetical protein